MKRRLTEEQAAQRLERRAGARAARALKVQALRDWHQERQAAAVRRAVARRHAERARRRKVSRGVDRVPESMRDLYLTVEPYTVSKHGTELARPEDLHPAGNHRDRRAQGQRGKQRRIRRRELPGAVERRLERARQEWLS